MKFVLTGCLLLGSHYGMMHHGSEECLADNPVTVLVNLEMVIHVILAKLHTYY